MATECWSRLLALGMLLIVGVRVTRTGDARIEEQQNKIEDILPHYVGDKHLDSFDQTLFLGGQAKAKAFRALSEDERKGVFKEVVNLVDKNSDGLLDKDELTEWVFEALVTVDKEDAANSMEPIDMNDDKKVSWFEYHDHVFGYKPGEEEEGNQAEYDKHIKRAKRTYDVADTDGDGFLDAKEFHMFHNPRFYREMEKVVILESLEDFDTNGDGGIQIEEYIGDFLTADEDEENLPEWVMEEKRMFETELDHDGNGKLEGTEIFELESQELSLREQAGREVDHLIVMADADADDHVSLDEALQSEVLFMGKDQHTHFNKNPNIILKKTEL